MKLRFNNILLPLFIVSSFLASSCTDDDEKFDPTHGLIKIAEGYAYGSAARVEVWSEQALFAGYNKIYFALYDSLTNTRILDSHIHPEPIMDMGTMSHSCPVEEPEGEAEDELFPAAIMFTMPTTEMGEWTLNVKVHNHNNGLRGVASFPVVVESKSPAEIVLLKNTETEQKYFIGYQFPDDLKVGVNDFETIIYTYVDGEFIPASNLTMKVTPEMLSMDHGSPNNVDPVHVASGHYNGKVNFTMTGEWRISLQLFDTGSELGIAQFDVLVK